MLTLLLSILVFSGSDTNGRNATWSNYGEGYKGTNGVPSLTLDSKPRVCTEGNICVGNSSGAPNYGLLFIGSSAGFTPTAFCGNLLVGCSPNQLVTKLISIPAHGLNLHVFYPCLNGQDLLIGTHFFMQVLQLDFGASDGVSFTEGLDIRIGF